MNYSLYRPIGIASLNNIGCQIAIAKNATNAVISSPPFEEGIIVESVARYFAVDVVIKEFQEN